MRMRTFAIITMPYGSFVVTANADGSIPLNTQCVAERDKHDRHGERLRALVDQANAAGELRAALADLFEHCAMVHKHWGEGSNNREANAAQERARKLLGRMP